MKAPPHSFFDDLQGLVFAALTVAVGVTMYSFCSLLTGSTAGLSFLLHYATGWPFGLIFFLINLPFYWFGLRRMGWIFTLKTFLSVSLISLMVDLMPQVMRFDFIDPLYASIAGGVLMGSGILIFIRHRASLGGVNILAVWLQQARGISAGKVQTLVDVLVLACAFFVLPLERALLSILGAVVLGLVLAVNHRPGRYMGL